MSIIHREPPIRAVPMNLFPTMDSLNDAVALAKLQLPITTEHALVTLLMTYHNTLLASLKKDALQH
jgi:hypothetical protein